MEKMDAGLSGLCIREITFYHTILLIHKIGSMQHYGSGCHGDLFCRHTVLFDLTKTYLDGF